MNLAWYCHNWDFETICSNKFDDAFQWKLTEMPDYKLNAIMTDFQYELPLQVIWNFTLIILYLHFPNLI
jgi:hypothetical protein